MFNTLSVNPAYAGSRGDFSGLLMHRSQWTGLNGAPETQVLNAHGTFREEGKLGFGVSVITESIGPTRETFFDLDLSYTIQLNAFGTLSFGIKGGGNLLDVAYSELLINNPNDPAVIPGDIQNRFSPNVGVGFYYNHSDRWYAGLSAPNLLETKHFDESSLSEIRERINYYLIGGYVFDLSPTWKFKPAFLAKAVSGSPLQVDFSANFLVNEKFTMGAAYRWDAAVSVLAGFQITDALMLGIAYDWETTQLGRTEFNSGSYEVFLRFELFRKGVSQINPRFF